MKKILLTLAVAAASVVAANAQFLIGGDLGFTYGSNEGFETPANVNVDNSTIGFQIEPKVGYELSDAMSVGAYLGFGYQKQENNLTNTDVKTTTWEVAPFLRYNCLSFGKFTVAAEATIGVAGESVADNYSTISFGVNVTPWLVYNLNEKWSLETGLNFLNLGWNYSSTDYDLAGVDDLKTNAFGIGVDANNIFNVGAITVGATYKF